MTIKKTNAERILEKEKIAYTPHTYDSTDGLIDGMAVAQKIGASPDRVFKTLVTVGASHEVSVFVLPVSKELDLKKAAKEAGEKSLAMLPVKDIMKVTGYIRGGCSPIGMKKNYKTYFDASALNFETIILSAGAIGYQIEAAACDIAKVTGGVFASLTI
ncbi:MAG: Cys-tRNA(Pro) deacylase [Oscillospiraceae bacterium]